MITYRLIKGSPINSAEYDGSLHDLDDRLTALEALPVGRGILSVAPDGTGNYLVITYTDLTLEDPIKMPITKYRSRGMWQPDTVYMLNDTVWFNGKTYPVTYSHTSGGSFDPGGNSGSGLDWYGEPMLEVAGLMLPEGGTTGQVLAKLSDADFDLVWVDALTGLPAGMFNGAVLGWASGAAVWQQKQITTIQHRLKILDLNFQKTQYFAAPFAGRIIGMDVIGQFDPVMVGGEIELQVQAVPSGVSVTVPDGHADGDIASDNASGDGFHFQQGYVLSLVLTGFAASPLMETGELQVQIRLRQD